MTVRTDAVQDVAVIMTNLGVDLDTAIAMRKVQMRTALDTDAAEVAGFTVFGRPATNVEEVIDMLASDDHEARHYVRFNDIVVADAFRSANV